MPIDLVFYPLDTSELQRKPCVSTNSSGVAAYTDEISAQKRALLELVERHSLLQNWLRKQTPPHLSKSLLTYHWRRRIDFWKKFGRTVHILNNSVGGVVVIQVLITGDNYPSFVSGSAASITSFEEALAKAFQEAEALIVSLIGNKIDAYLELESVKSPIDHGNFYANPTRAHLLQWLYTGKHRQTKPPMVSTDFTDMVKTYQPTAVKMENVSSKNPLTIVRVLSEHLLPISFGYYGMYHAHSTLHGTTSLPSLPHYFA